MRRSGLTTKPSVDLAADDDANPALRSAKGGVVGRNNTFAPWVNSFDVRLSQAGVEGDEVPAEGSGWLPDVGAPVLAPLVVAGTVGGSKYGVAQNVSLVAVRVLDCGGSGSWSGVVAGMDYVASTTTRPITER